MNLEQVRLIGSIAHFGHKASVIGQTRSNLYIERMCPMAHKKYSEEKWREFIRDCEIFAGSTEAFCRGHGISSRSLRRWKKTFQKRRLETTSDMSAKKATQSDALLVYRGHPPISGEQLMTCGIPKAKAQISRFQGLWPCWIG